MTSLDSHRPFTGWGAWRIGPIWPVTEFADTLSADLLWDQLNLLAKVPKKGLALYSCVESEQATRWQGLNDFVRQAKSYHDALSVTPGTARALLGYYSALNLAKAELLHSAPDSVLDVKIHHGLSFDVASATSLEEDRVKVLKDGVFPLLFEARTGLSIPNGTTLSVRELLARVPELTHEYYQYFDERPPTVRAWVAMVMDESHYWLDVLLNAKSDAIMATPEWSGFDAAFKEVALAPGYKSFFVGAPYRPADLCMFEQRNARRMRAGGVIPAALFGDLKDCLGASINNAFEWAHGFDFVPSMSLGIQLPMPSFLARYAIMFYLSSLVRYRPSRLNPDRVPLDSWIMESFARQSPVRLLADAYDGISRQTSRYEYR